jgi:hypothetical protein
MSINNNVKTIDIDKLKSSILSNSINVLYPNLIQRHKNLLLDYATRVFYVLFCLYSDDVNEISFITELSQNNYECMNWIITFLLPYINIDSGKTYELSSIEDIYTKKLKDVDINKDCPSYKFSNIQYGRYMYSDSDKSKIKELDFDEDHIKHNYILLLDSIIKSSHKLCVNWIDIIPFSLNHLLNDRPNLLLNTEKKFNSRSLSDIDVIKISDVSDISITSYESIKNDLNSLNVEDIYNTIRNYFYEDIRKVKYLIYDIVIKTDSGDNILSPAIYILNTIFFNSAFLTNVLANNNYEDLTEKDKTVFEDILNVVINKLENNEDYPLDQLSIDRTSLSRLFRSIVMSFDLFNRDRKLAGYKPINKDYINEDLDEIKDEFDVSFKYNQENMIGDLLENFKSIKPDYLYEFFSSSILKFKTTYYGYCLLNESKTDITKNIYSSENLVVGLNKKLKAQAPLIKAITFKNLYNYAKSLSIYKIKDGFGKYPRYYQSFTKKDKKEILDRLNFKNNDWFNVKRYLRYTLTFSDPTKTFNVDDYNVYLHELIRGYLVKHIFQCLITKGVLSRLLFNPKITDQSISVRRECNKVLKDTIFQKIEDNHYWHNSFYYVSELPYQFSGNLFDYNCDNSWYSMTAIHWVSQIGFFHHYINNRVMYITGATGVGKSVLVPILFMYATKAIDYKSISTTICTQPRTAPTTNNAVQVAKQIGYPIYNKEDNTENEDYYIQFKHSQRKHINNCEHLVLKYVTDGSLLAELKNSMPLLKKIIDFNKNIYSPDNIYDIIIVDEAHEHNKNMDLLLTVIREYCLYNPSLKLVILSATMDNDEPTYRRFYRPINDNLKYPITCDLEHYKLDRINVDRRYHISPPGVGTRGKIVEIYKPGESVLNIVKEIIRNGIVGDILVFQPGEGEITKLIEELNANTPGNIIAIPFFSKLVEYKRKIIEDDKYEFIKMPKNKNFADENVDPNEGISSYTHFIIIATTIAEASLTIKRLSYVIETGTSKRQIYDYNNKTSVLKTLDISESSRLQRKGRVGRIKDGVVYYTYEKDKMKDNKILCEISITNLGDDIYNLLRENNSIKLFDINKITKDIVFREFYLTSENKVFNYKGLSKHFDYSINDYDVKIYNTSQYHPDNLIDNKGSFYIVHPDEPNLIRDLAGRIVGIRNKDDVTYYNYLSEKYGYVTSNKMNSFFDDLEIMNYLTDKDLGYEKTKYGFFVNTAIDTFPTYLDRNYARVLLNSILFYNDLNNKLNDNVNDIIIIISSLSQTVLSNDITKLFTPDEQKRINVDRLLNIIKKNINGDIYVILDIFKSLLNFINHDNILSIEENIKYYCIDKKKNYSVLLKLIKTFDVSDKSEKREEHVEKIINYIVDIKHAQTLKNRISEFLTRYLEFFDQQIFNKIINFIKIYLLIRDCVLRLYNPNKRDINYVDDIVKYSIKYKYYDVSDKHIMSFLLALPYNLVTQIKTTNNYISMYNPQVNNIYVIKKLKILRNSRNAYIESTFIDEMYKKNNLLYLSLDVATDSIMTLINIPDSYLKYLNKIYNKNRLGKLLNSKQKSISKYLKKINFEKEKKIPHTNFEYGVNLYVSSIQRIISVL